MNRQQKDRSSTEFTFLRLSHKLGLNDYKESFMATITFVLFILVRVLIPAALLIGLGEWVRRREAHYWLQK